MALDLESVEMKDIGDSIVKEARIVRDDNYWDIVSNIYKRAIEIDILDVQ